MGGKQKWGGFGVRSAHAGGVYSITLGLRVQASHLIN